MARMNIEEELEDDPRFWALSERVGGEPNALWMLYKFWKVAQKYWGQGRKLVPVQIFDLLKADALFEVHLAEKRPEGVYAKGSEERFDWYLQKCEAGRKRAEKTRRTASGQFTPGDADQSAENPATDQRLTSGSPADDERLTSGSPAAHQLLIPVPVLTPDLDIQSSDVSPYSEGCGESEPSLMVSCPSGDAEPLKIDSGASEPPPMGEDGPRGSEVAGACESANKKRVSRTATKPHCRTWEKDDPFSDIFRHLIAIPQFVSVFDRETDRSKILEYMSRYALTPKEVEQAAFDLREWASSGVRAIRSPRGTFNTFCKNAAERRNKQAHRSGGLFQSQGDQPAWHRGIMGDKSQYDFSTLSEDDDEQDATASA